MQLTQLIRRPPSHLSLRFCAAPLALLPLRPRSPPRTKSHREDLAPVRRSQDVWTVSRSRGQRDLTNPPQNSPRPHRCCNRSEPLSGRAPRNLVLGRPKCSNVGRPQGHVHQGLHGNGGSFCCPCLFARSTSLSLAHRPTLSLSPSLSPFLPFACTHTHALAHPPTLSLLYPPTLPPSHTPLRGNFRAHRAERAHSHSSTSGRTGEKALRQGTRCKQRAPSSQGHATGACESGPLVT